ncbi:uncharacterized protein LY79DRAFT_593856 [Colletotrichum navitas]|uniref:BTB domain-containing protein n=1 Tax=Colletotrichum navitas TaxID=681940 RepID=A0AAD8PQ41_9PEZI|nr:uncharacterized protein LY79DRAFT_593856 [Colletotrichum navitas]KAK1573623.1 hypothetical protein LY79DRAFT_593856 [Colletotrichum navitas]
MPNRRGIDKDEDLILQLSGMGLENAGADVADREETDESVNKKPLNCAQILMLTSPVFKTMLGKKFKEAAELAKIPGFKNAYITNLPIDHIEAMATLCQIFHTVYVSPRSETTSLSKLSLIVDLLLRFSEVSWRILLQHEGTFLSTSDQVKILAGHPLLRHDIIRKPIPKFLYLIQT